MAKQSGLGDQLFIGGYDIGADVLALGSLSTPRATLPATAITQSAEARFYGQRDASAEFNAFFNPAAGETHSRLKLLPTTDTQLMYLRGAGIGNESFSMVGKQMNYDGNRGDDGSFTFTVQAQSNGFGADWGTQLTAGKQTDTAATNGASIDTLASASFGFQAYLQVFAFTGTSVTVSLEDSADNVTFAPITGGSFTAATGIAFERIQSVSDTATVRRYIRAVTAGTFSSATFAVSVTKNDAQRVL